MFAAEINANRNMYEEICEGRLRFLIKENVRVVCDKGS